MARVQLALNVSDLDAAVDFYSRLFATTPTKVRPGYANFAVVDPPLKLVLIEHRGAGQRGIEGTLNHLGVEVGSSDDVVRASRQLSEGGMATTEQSHTTCCYALQDKVWVQDPDGAAWEIYTVLADAPAETGVSGDGTCCGEPAGSAEQSHSSSSSCC